MGNMIRRLINPQIGILYQELLDFSNIRKQTTLKGMGDCWTWIVPFMSFSFKTDIFATGNQITDWETGARWRTDCLFNKYHSVIAR